MDRVEKMLGRMKASKLYRCVDRSEEHTSELQSR